MFPVKFIGEISKIINSYCDRYVVDKHSRIILEPRKDDIYICRAFLNDLRNLEGYQDFMITNEVAKDLRDIKMKTIIEEKDMMGNIVISGATALSPTAKGYREIETTLVHGVEFQHVDDLEKMDFLEGVWVRAGSLNYTVVPANELVGVNKFLEINVLDNHGEEDTLLTSTSEFYFGKTFIDLSAAVVDPFSLFQHRQEEINHCKYVIIRVRYEELTLYMLVAISI